jgi:hypothetical protein
LRQPYASISPAVINGITTPDAEMPVAAMPKAIPRLRLNQFATSLAVASPPMALAPKPMKIPNAR